MIDTVEVPFTIADADLETFPLSRLAEYLADLADLFGSRDQVHFGAVRPGSLVVVAKVEQAARPVVFPRIRAAARGEDPSGSKAWARLNGKLSDDGTTAKLKLPGEVIILPGLPRAETPVGPFRQPTTLQGQLTRIEGAGDPVYVGIEDDAGLAGQVTMPAAVAKELGAYFQRYVRLTGEGRWKRKNGRWLLERLDATAFEVLDDTPLDDVLRRVRDMIPPGAGASAIREIGEFGEA
ncbi:hypothetical protein [Methylocystis sp.]|uniref:hypothetical protein n=1 Tax=Methylocystis sp. TaxID=1911079 RepID=UPI002732B9FE|nr:hypothetical protein [Methylocystis sp.]MDP3552811.1 hypothetical protein [Methylocystis sp.]